MIRNVWPFCVLATVFVWAQVQPTDPSAPHTASGAGQANGQHAVTPASSIAPDTPVLTIKGLCSQPAAGSTSGPNPGCSTVVTRAEFERLMEVLRADRDPQSRNQLVTMYPQILVLAHEAVARGLDKQERVQERLRFARLQILSQELVGQVREEAAQVPAKDIDAYYHQNTSQFEQVTLDRIVVPNRAQGTKQGTADEAALGKLAESLRARAAAGEDFGKLQKEAYDAAGLSGDTETNPRMEKLRRPGLPPAHASVFDMRTGEVSPVISDVSGHYIYKLESRETESLEAVTSEISKTLRRQRLEKMIHEVEQPFTTDVNQAYFAAEGNANKN